MTVIYRYRQILYTFYSCWLSTESGSLYMFIVPVCLIAVVSLDRKGVP